MIEWMYLASRSPRSSNTSSWIFWNSAPISSICSGVSRLSGLWISGGAASAVVIAAVLLGFLSELDFHGSLRRVHAGPAGHALHVHHFAAAEVPQLPGAELPHTRMADAHPAAERQLEPGLLAGHENGRAAVALHFLVGVDEGDRAALALGAVAADHRLEALHVQAVAVGLAVPVLAQRVEHVARPRGERLALAPVRAQLVQVRGLHAADLGRALLVQPEAVVLPGQRAQLGAEDHLVGVAGRVEMHHVAHRIAPVKAPQHAHDRRDAAPGADEE